MRLSMSFSTRRELLARVAPRYREASKKQKTDILNEFIASTGYKRKYAIRLLSLPEIPAPRKIKRPRSRFYGKSLQEALKTAWCASNCIASKRLAPFLAELVPILEHHGHLELSGEERRQLVSISPATIDRILKPYRQLSGRGSTKKGSLLKHQVPIRTFADWEEKIPGFFEADLVVHCGWSMGGSFLCTLTLTDIATTWTECMPLLYRSQEAVIHALDQACSLIPFPILGLDCDNGKEFLNAELIAYCEREKITFTRSRAYRKNDQCYVEQKNGAVVRQFVGYDRFEGLLAYKQLLELYRALRLYQNFFQPSMKLREKHRERSRVYRSYDSAQTPLQRLRVFNILSPEAEEKINSIHQAIDPVCLLKQIGSLQDALWRHAIQPLPAIETTQEKPELCFDGISGAGSGNEKSPFTPGDVLQPEIRSKRKYRKSKKTRAPRWWRSRPDPFELVNDEIRCLLEENPEWTAKSIFQEIQKRYPGHYKDGQLRTLQRRVKAWRAEALIAFDDSWIQSDKLADLDLPKPLRGEIKSHPQSELRS